MPFVFIMHSCSPPQGSIHSSCQAFDSVYQPRRVCMMLECSTGELIPRDAFMHHDDKRHDALKQCAVLKGLSLCLPTCCSLRSQYTPAILIQTTDQGCKNGRLLKTSVYIAFRGMSIMWSKMLRGISTSYLF